MPSTPQMPTVADGVMPLLDQLKRAHSMGISKPEAHSLYGDAAVRIEELETKNAELARLLSGVRTMRVANTIPAVAERIVANGHDLGKMGYGDFGYIWVVLRHYEAQYMDFRGKTWDEMTVQERDLSVLVSWCHNFIRELAEIDLGTDDFAV